MGGESITSLSSTSDAEEVSSGYQQSPKLSSLSDEGLSDVLRQVSSSSSSLDIDVTQRRLQNAYEEVLKSYIHSPIRSKNLEEAKTKILSYVPGLWIDKVGGMKLSDYDVPKTTTLLLIGPKGSGKSSLINRISKVFDDDKYTSERAQVSYNSLRGDGTFFLQEYMIPRNSAFFCLYDSRSLSSDLSDNFEMIKSWMTKGVRHGELVVRESDSMDLRNNLKCKAHDTIVKSCEIRSVNFVVFVLDGFEFLKALDDDGNASTKTSYMHMISETFNCPNLSFKNDKPVVVVTHGDLLSPAERTHIRVRLGELLGIHPAKQIFDIPDTCEATTDLAILDVLRYSLEHADRNLPCKKSGRKVGGVSLSQFVFLFTMLGVLIFLVACIWPPDGHLALSSALVSSKLNKYTEQKNHAGPNCDNEGVPKPKHQAALKPNDPDICNPKHQDLLKAKHQDVPKQKYEAVRKPKRDSDEEEMEWKKISRLWLDETAF